MTDEELFRRLREIAALGWLPVPDERGWRGTDAPAKLLLRRLGVAPARRRDRPNAGEWHVQFHGGGPSGMLTLFGSMGEPEGYLEPLLRRFGRPRADGGVSFTHTIRGESDKGFRVVNEGGRIALHNPAAAGLALPRWTHRGLEASFARKHGRLVVVSGEVRRPPREVRYRGADAFLEPRVGAFADAVAAGSVAIEFNVKTRRDGSLRDHGVRFRVPAGELPGLYGRHIPLQVSAGAD